VGTRAGDSPPLHALAAPHLLHALIHQEVVELVAAGGAEEQARASGALGAEGGRAR
jgi:hypothetical protein